MAALSLDGEPELEPLIELPGREAHPQFSHDGRYVAFRAEDTGRGEIYVLELESGRRWLISTDGGTRPIWTRDGGEILFTSEGRRVSVAVSTEPEFRWEPPEVLHSIQGYAADFDVTRDGTRFLELKTLASEEAESSDAGRFVVVLDWFSELVFHIEPLGTRQGRRGLRGGGVVAAATGPFIAAKFGF